MCESEMPFKKRDGEYYFEEIEIANKELFFTKFPQKLALCPTCAAKYKEYIIRHSLEKQTAVLEKAKKCEPCENDSGEAVYKIEIEVERQPQTIRFTQDHIDDIKTILTTM
jgi:hypothetical protein